MRSSWRLPNARVSLHDWNEKDVILDFNGPQLVLLESEGRLYLSVASDADEEFVRWLRAPISNHEYRALLAGETTVLECIRKPEILVVDTDQYGTPTAEYSVSADSLNDENLPLAGSVLPDEIVSLRRHSVG